MCGPGPSFFRLDSSLTRCLIGSSEVFWPSPPGTFLFEYERPFGPQNERAQDSRIAVECSRSRSRAASTVPGTFSRPANENNSRSFERDGACRVQAASIEESYMLDVFPLIVGVVVGGLLLLLGGVMILAIVLTAWKGMCSHGWPTAFGRVVSVEIATGPISPMPEADRAASEDSSQPELVYEYEVDGKRFTGNTVQVQGNVQTDRSQRRERELLKRYSAGQAVLVFYNPRKPDEATLQPGIPRGLLPMTAWGGVLFTVGLVLVLIFSGAMRFPPSPRVAGIVFFVPGWALVLFGFRSMWLVVASRNWPATQAKVTHSTVVPGSESQLFQPSVIYEYEVQGESYVGTAIDWGRSDMSCDDAQRIADKYPVGEAVME